MKLFFNAVANIIISVFRMTAEMMSSDSKDVKMALNGPIFFLIQEHAKSAVTIQVNDFFLILLFLYFIINIHTYISLASERLELVGSGLILV